MTASPTQVNASNLNAFEPNDYGLAKAVRLLFPGRVIFSCRNKRYYERRGHLLDAGLKFTG